MCVQYGAEDATLGRSCVQGEGSGGVFAHPDPGTVAELWGLEVPNGSGGTVAEPRGLAVRPQRVLFVFIV